MACSECPSRLTQEGEIALQLAYSDGGVSGKDTQTVHGFFERGQEDSIHVKPTS